MLGDWAEEEGGEVQEDEGARRDVLWRREAAVLWSVESRAKCVEVIAGRVWYGEKGTGQRGLFLFCLFCFSFLFFFGDFWLKWVHGLLSCLSFVNFCGLR